MSNALSLHMATPGLDFATKQRAVASGRSWWQARYRDGRILSEWDTVTNRVRSALPRQGAGSTSRWEDVSKKGLIALRLICPNGNAGVLESQIAGRFFQLKAGYVDVVVGGKPFCEAHIIGMVMDDGNRCVCWAWETREKRLVKFEDQFHNMAYRRIGALSIDVQGVRL